MKEKEERRKESNTFDDDEIFLCFCYLKWTTELEVSVKRSCEIERLVSSFIPFISIFVSIFRLYFYFILFYLLIYLILSYYCNIIANFVFLPYV